MSDIENYKLAERLFNVIFDDKELDYMEEGEFIACKRGYKATLIAEMVLEMESAPQDNWISVETPDDIDVFEDILCFDGCEASIDYVEVCPNTGAHYMANDTPVTHYQRLPTPPKESK